MPVETDIVRRVEAVSLPTPPAVAMRLSQLLARESTTGDDLAAAIQLDAGMAARVLRLANSVALGGTSAVDSIPEAVLRVGVDGVRNVVFALSMVGALKPMHFDHRPFWRHSLAVAHTAQILQMRAMKIGSPFPETYSAGLLHDLGMLVLDRALGEQYHDVMDAARTTGRPLFEIEHEWLGINHSQAGGRMLEVWKLPVLLIDAARSHHRPWTSESVVTQLVHLADFVCNNQGIHHGTGWFPQSCPARVWDELGIEEAEMPNIILEVQRELIRAEEILKTAV